MSVSDRHAQYEPVAWWFTKRRLGRELGNCYPVPEELPARLLTLISELDGKPEVSLAVGAPQAATPPCHDAVTRVCRIGDHTIFRSTDEVLPKAPRSNSVVHSFLN
jgi:hypothetical protein